MLIIPAIDILDGKVARLTRGDFKFEKVYSDNPLGVALKWAGSGARMIHIVDLDGARSGEFKNLGAIEKIVRSIKADVQLGGGVRDEKVIQEALSRGIERVIIGTRATDEDFVRRVVDKFKDKVIFGVDAREGKIAVSGWKETTEFKTIDFVKRLESLAAGTIVFTDILKDGTLSGPNFKALEEVLNSTSMDVIASGGVASIEDLLKLKKLEPKRPVACIVGKALYEKKLDLKEAIQKCQ